jgi:hypothetical protein
MIGAFAIVVVLVTGRCLAFVLFEQAQFDADQAVTGLMAKHIAERRAFPFYAYGANYVLVVEAWLAAPFVGLFGLSVAALRIPLVLLNATAGVLLVGLLARELTLRPLVALVPALFFVAAPPVLSAELLTAVGGNVEPFVYVLLLWLTRTRPVLFGVIFVVGFLNREFTAYAVSALLVVEAFEGRLWRRDNLRQKAIVAAVVVAGLGVARLLRARADVLGPGTAGMGDASASNVSVALAFLCPTLDPARIGANLSSLVGIQAPTLLALFPFRLATVNIMSPTIQGVAGLRTVFYAVMLGAALRLAWLAVRSRGRDAGGGTSPRAGLWFALYLGLIGLQSGVVWALSRCGPLDWMTLRYGLLTVFVPIALVAAYLAIERRAAGRWLVVLFVVAWAAVSLRAHADLLVHFRSGSRQSEYRLVADELVARGIGYVQTDYWAAYMIDFLTDERVIATATDYMRIREYDVEVTRHIDRAVRLSRTPCAGGEAVRVWYLCKAREDR